MDTKGVIDVGELEEERSSLGRKVDELQHQLTQTQRRLHDIEVILETWARIQGELSPSDASPAPPATRETSEKQPLVERTAGAKRIPSTRMVVDLVQSEKKSWTREEIHRAFEERYGFPESWTNPTNALNNAISRGVESGKMKEDAGGYRAVSE